MSSEHKPPKPMPSAAEINAYLEQSAARTKMRLPLAKGNAVPAGMSPPAPASPGAAAGRALPVRSKILPTQATASEKAPSEPAAVWTPFGDDRK
jgi:hypothetical protein